MQVAIINQSSQRTHNLLDVHSSFPWDLVLETLQWLSLNYKVS